MTKLKKIMTFAFTVVERLQTKEIRNATLRYGTLL